MKWTFNSPGIVKSFHQPKSFFINDFNSNTVRAFNNCVTEALELQQQIMPIYIESPGGDVYALNGILSIMDAARKNGLKFATISTGQAMSAGAMVFCYGDQSLRFLGEHAVLMLHGMSGGFGGKVSEMKDFFVIQEKFQNETFEKISRHLKKKADWIRKQIDLKKDRDWYITAKEAIDMNIIDKIGVPIFSLEITAGVQIIM